MKRNFKLLMLISWSVLILVLIAWPTPEYNGTEFTWYDKAVHAVLFGVFSFLAFRALHYQKIRFFRSAFVAFLSGIAYSAVCEFIQRFVPGRTVSEYDFFAGALGSLVAVLILYIYEKNK